MNDKQSRLIFNTRAQIQANKKKGYRVQPLTYLGKEAVRIECKDLGIDFLIDPETLSDLKGRFMRSGLYRYITFYDWLLKTEV